MPRVQRPCGACKTLAAALATDLWRGQETIGEGRTFSILQPGSSVATALSEGEAKKKHIVVRAARPWVFSMAGQSKPPCARMHVMACEVKEAAAARSSSARWPGGEAHVCACGGRSMLWWAKGPVLAQVLEILGEQWRTFKVALQTVRPFQFDNVRLPAPRNPARPPKSTGRAQ